jgi:hypothetical protein
MQNRSKKPAHLWPQDMDEALAERDKAIRRRAQLPPSKPHNWVRPVLIGGAVVLGFFLWRAVEAI